METAFKDSPHVYRRSDGRWDVDMGLKRPRRQICETLEKVARVKSDWEAEYKRGGTQRPR
jgi:hypothetical protein